MGRWSVSKRPFPTSQSQIVTVERRVAECIKEAVPDQPEQTARRIGLELRVYQRGRSRPARAHAGFFILPPPSVSKRPFPTSQSPDTYNAGARDECIKEAVPDQPEQRNGRLWALDGVYQRGRSRPARADATISSSVAGSVSKRPFPTSQSWAGPTLSVLTECIKEAVPDQPEQPRQRHAQRPRVYQRGRSRPARAMKPRGPN